MKNYEWSIVDFRLTIATMEYCFFIRRMINLWKSQQKMTDVRDINTVMITSKIRIKKSFSRLIKIEKQISP